MRYHYIPVGMAKILSINTTKCWQGCGETGTLFIAVKRMKNGTETLEESLAVSYKSKHTLITQFSIPTAGIYKKELKTGVHKNLLLMGICCNIVNSQTWKQPRCP